jgi:hypothetical protein
MISEENSIKIVVFSDMSKRHERNLQTESLIWNPQISVLSFEIVKKLYGDSASQIVRISNTI